MYIVNPGFIPRPKWSVAFKTQGKMHVSALETMKLEQSNCLQHQTQLFCLLAVDSKMKLKQFGLYRVCLNVHALLQNERDDLY